MIYFTTLPIVLSTVGAFVLGALWYSPILFQKFWLIGEGMTKGDIPKRSVSYMVRTSIYALIAHGCIAAVMAFVFELLEVDTMKLALSLGALMAIGFIVSSRYIDMVYTPRGNDYDRNNQIKFLVSAGYYVAMLLVISGVLFLTGR